VAEGDRHLGPAAIAAIGQDDRVPDQEYPRVWRVGVDALQVGGDLRRRRADLRPELVGPARGVVALARRAERVREAERGAVDDDVAEPDVVAADLQRDQ